MLLVVGRFLEAISWVTCQKDIRAGLKIYGNIFFLLSRYNVTLDNAGLCNNQNALTQQDIRSNFHFFIVMNEFTIHFPSPLCYSDIIFRGSPMDIFYQILFILCACIVKNEFLEQFISRLSNSKQDIVILSYRNETFYQNLHKTIYSDQSSPYMN